jgi:hypothetical protein
VQKARPTANKRLRERQRADRRKEKAQRRQESSARRAAAPPRVPGEDPDIAGIRPGPQPSPYADMIEDFDKVEETEEQ